MPIAPKVIWRVMKVNPTRAPMAIPMISIMSESFDILVPTVSGLYWEVVNYYWRTRYVSLITVFSNKETRGQ